MGASLLVGRGSVLLSAELTRGRVAQGGVHEVQSVSRRGVSLVGHGELGSETRLDSRAPEVPLVRQLSAPGRLAVWIAASLAVAASAGCMSVSDDEGGKPAPRSTADRHGTAAEPDGGPAPGGRHADGVRDASDTPGGKGADGKGASPKPSASAGPAANPTPGGAGPRPPGLPEPTRGGVSPSVPPQAPPQPSPSEPPPASPTPPPSEPSDPPSASSAPQVHAGAMRAAEWSGMQGEPTASPQVGPM
ncbi:hypothetical protein FBY35_7128 [Streptomyces sp. SLBN-118]|nr:hypothetical protein FBY35_7128 [Streptomyces sp. SLBN-118]